MLKVPSGATETVEDNELFAEVAGVLWSERELLEHLLFKLVQEQLVLAAGSTRWLNHTDAELQLALDRVRLGEVARAIQVEALAQQLNRPITSTLAELAAIAPEPWSLVLGEHRSALRALVAEIDAVAAENRRLLHVGANAIRETLDRLGDAVAGYDANGSAVRFGSAAGSFLLDAQV